MPDVRFNLGLTPNPMLLITELCGPHTTPKGEHASGYPVIIWAVLSGPEVRWAGGRTALPGEGLQVT